SCSLFASGLQIALLRSFPTRRSSDLTVTLFFSTFMKGSGSVAFITIFVVFAMSTVASILTKYMKWSPASMTDYASESLLSGELNSSFLLAFISTLFIIIGMLILSIQIIKQKELLE